jgi:hypothetical protein
VANVFASQHKEEITVGDLAVIIRKLSGKSLRAAREVRTLSDAKGTRALGGEVLKALNEDREERTAKRKPTKEQRHLARLALYDRDDILRRGIDSWSEKGVGIIDGLEDLDEKSSQTLFEAIIELSLGKLEEDEAADRKAADEGKDSPSSHSTGSSTT